MKWETRSHAFSISLSSSDEGCLSSAFLENRRCYFTSVILRWSTPQKCCPLIPMGVLSQKTVDVKQRYRHFFLKNLAPLYYGREITSPIFQENRALLPSLGACRKVEIPARRRDRVTRFVKKLSFRMKKDRSQTFARGRYANLQSLCQRLYY